MPSFRAGVGRAFVALGLLVAAAEPAGAQGRPVRPCVPVVFENAGYTVCTVDVRRYRLGLFWRGPDGEPYGSLGRLVASEAGRRLVFAMNAIAIIPLAGLLSHATESVAHKLGDTLGALLNVSFGNAVELIIL